MQLIERQLHRLSRHLVVVQESIKCLDDGLHGRDMLLGKDVSDSRRAEPGDDESWTDAIDSDVLLQEDWTTGSGEPD